jgi:hypothetical protein
MQIKFRWKAEIMKDVGWKALRHGPTLGVGLTIKVKSRRVSGSLLWTEWSSAWHFTDEFPTARPPRMTSSNRLVSGGRGREEERKKEREKRGERMNE